MPLRFAKRTRKASKEGSHGEVTNRLKPIDEGPEEEFPLETENLKQETENTSGHGVAAPVNGNGKRESTHAGFLSVRAEIRRNSYIKGRLEKIANLPNVRLWKLYVRLKEDQSLSNSRLRKAVRQIIIDRYEPDIARVVRSYAARKLPQKSLCTTMDLYQCAMAAHSMSVDIYDPSFGTTYMQFFNARDSSRLMGSIIDGLRKVQDFPRSIAAARRNLNEKIELLSHELGRSPTNEDIIDAFGSDAEIVCDSLFRANVLSQTQISSDNDEDNACDLSIGKPVSTILRGDSGEPNPDARTKLLGLIHVEEVRNVIDAYYFGGLLNVEVAAKFNMSESKASDCRQRGERILRSKLTSEQMKRIISDT